MNDVVTQMRKLDEFRRKVTELSSKRERLLGEIEANKKTLSALKQKLQEEFAISVDDIPALTASFESDISKGFTEIESLLRSK